MFSSYESAQTKLDKMLAILQNSENGMKYSVLQSIIRQTRSPFLQLLIIRFITPELFGNSPDQGNEYVSDTPSV